jgi:hypothetical protein
MGYHAQCVRIVRNGIFCYERRFFAERLHVVANRLYGGRGLVIICLGNFAHRSPCKFRTNFLSKGGVHMNFTRLLEERARESVNQRGYRYLQSDREEHCVTYGELATNAHHTSSRPNFPFCSLSFWRGCVE